ncbi:50S ribosomal protein L10 [Propioniciclava sp. MC1595]|uniref:50S ribosomal protein L10 n=1 Tax=Propioniciclava sp. MC1595 TaxID=2760308 RepID=UPI001662476F|nr:50S ribosomal protein L10 [Propioniciclava sp. MC1595]MBB1494341.1 50S ribosomal protein L10 [Propioniciclava sp. MC1595]QTE25316.1 50S ribosomal protein L10 [Propioniciclava sp. MC1595]
MARPDKAAAVEELKEAFSASNATVLTEYRGLTVKSIKALRRALGEDATYAVAKNTLTQIAAKEAGIEGLDEQLTGPTAIAFINGDVATVAKGLRDFAKDNPLLVIKGGVMDGRVLDANAVKKLADLESREVLLAKLAGAMQANLSKAVYLIAAPLSQAARVLGALEAAAGENPSLIGGAGQAAPAEDQKPDTAEAASAPEAAPAAEADDTAAESAE